MSIDWREIQKRYDELSQELISSDLPSEKRLALQKESSHLAQLLSAHGQLEELTKSIEDLELQLSQNDDEELSLLFLEEIEEKRDALLQATADLDDLLYPPDEHDNRSVYLEIRPGTGGQEAALFARDLVKMYTNYALLKNWKVSVESISETDLGGIREIVLHIRGKGVFGALKHESGVHRVQRVPQTEGSGRVHTSTATVAVLPEAKEVDVTISPSDLRIDVYRASGAGGQHVNTTDSAVRITHIPTGVVVTCQDERSQHKNKAKALKMLHSRILMAQKEASHAQMSQQRKEQVGSGMRSEKVRTYNYPQNRVTDHQVGLTLKKLDMVMQGDIEEIITALQKKDREARKNIQRSLISKNL